MQKLIKAIPKFLLLVLMFYAIYPQALDVRGSSFVFLSGIIGLGIYTYHRFPFKEVTYLLISLAIMYVIFFNAGYINNQLSDYFLNPYFRSEIAYIFTAYLVVFLLYKAYDKLTFNTLVFYISAAIILQAIITFAMYLNKDIKEFFLSLQLQTEYGYTDEVLERISTERLTGYGIAFFGAGVYYGIGLITIAYLLMKQQLSKLKFSLLSGAYIFTFYIGLFTARTTLVGMGASIILIVILYFIDNKSNKKHLKFFFIVFVLLLIAGYSFALYYFPQFSYWGFEAFYNFLETGKVRTHSSDGLKGMFMIPKDIFSLIFGTGSMMFFGSDVGYTRALFYAGIPGALAYYLQQYFVVWLSRTKDWSINILPITLFLFNLVINVKGISSINNVLYMIFFYFMFYKYYVFIPNRLELRNENRKMNAMLKRQNIHS